MLTVFIVIHLLIAISMIALILLQKTEGNAAGGGFSVSSMSSMMQPRARANPLSTATAILGLTFFVSSISLALLAKHLGPAPSVLDDPASAAAGSTRAPRVDEINNAPPADAPGAAATPAAPADTSATPETPAPATAAPAAPPAVPKN